MRGLIAAGCLAFAALAGASSAAAAAPTLTAEGKCVIEISSDGIGAGELCKRMTLKENPASGETIVTFEFERDMVVEFEGPGIRVGAWLMMSPARMRWTSPGGKPIDLANKALEPDPQVTGRCANALQAEGTQLYETYCKVQTPLGVISLTFKVPRAEK